MLFVRCTEFEANLMLFLSASDMTLKNQTEI